MLRRLANGLIVCGALLVVCGGVWQLGVVPGSRVTLEQPFALEPSRPIATSAANATALTPIPTELPRDPESTSVSATSTPASRAMPVVAPTLVPLVPPTPAPLPIRLIGADSADRNEANRFPPPGYAVRLVIPAIKVDTAVEQGGIIRDAQGNPTWQTLPFVAVHYGDLTALVGARGNAVIAGHVVSQREGNVFQRLYQIQLDSRIQVWDDADREHQFHVVDVHLVSPSDTSPMTQTPDPTLTLITCGGTFDSATRQFSERLIVTAKPVTE